MFQGANVDGVCVEIRNDQVIDGCLCGQLTACVAQVGAQAWWCLRVLIGIYLYGPLSAREYFGRYLSTYVHKDTYIAT